MVCAFSIFLFAMIDPVNEPTTPPRRPPPASTNAPYRSTSHSSVSSYTRRLSVGMETVIVEGKVHVSACSNGLFAVEHEAREILNALGYQRCTLAPHQHVNRLSADLAGCTVWIFCGHLTDNNTGSKTLAFVDEAGRPAVIDPSKIASIVRAHVDTLRCVLLNGCDSLELGRQLIQAGVQHVICWRTRVHDEAAKHFSLGFARALANGATYAAAYYAGCTAVTARVERSGQHMGQQRFELADPDRSNRKNGRLSPVPPASRGPLAAGCPKLLTSPVQIIVTAENHHSAHPRPRTLACVCPALWRWSTEHHSVRVRSRAAGLAQRPNHQDQGPAVEARGPRGDRRLLAAVRPVRAWR